MLALIYCRVSTEEQAREGYSLDAQEKLCRYYTESHGYTIKAVYRDEGKSGTKLNRPALQDMLSECQQNDEIEAVIVQETDRLARNTHDHLTIRMVLKKAGVNLVSVNQPMLDDSPEGNMVDTILASVNQFQSDLNGRKVRKALLEKFETGWFPCPAPIGYKSVPLGGEDLSGERRARKIIVKDETTWPLIREAFMRYLSGTHSVEAVNDLAYSQGLRSKKGRKLSHSMMSRILQNPFYAGQMLWKGELRTGRHEAIISLSECQQVLDIMANHNQNACRRRKHQFLLRGYAFCGICGQRYTAEIHPKKRKSYYHCVSRGAHSNQGQNVEASVLEEQVAEQFGTIQLNKGIIDKALAKFQFMAAEKQAMDMAERQTLWNKRKAVVATRDRLEERLLAGVLDDEAFSRLRSKVQLELVHVDGRLRELEDTHDSDIDILRMALELMRDTYKAYRKAPDDLKKQYIAVFWEKFLIKDRRVIEATPTKLVRALQEIGEVVINGGELRAIPTVIITLFEDRKYWSEVKEKLAQLSLYSSRMAA